MRIVRLLGAVAAGLVALHFAWGSLAAGGEHAPLDWRGGGVARGAGIVMRYPAGWYATSQDRRDIVVSSFPVSRRWLATERRSVPKGGVFIRAFSYGRLPAGSDPSFPPRPAQLQLDPKTFGFYECGLRLEGYLLRFRERGLAVQMEVALGPGADRAAALAIVNRLRVG